MVLFFYNYTRIPTSKLIPCVSLEGLIHPFRSQYTYVFLPAGGMYRRGRLMTAAAWGWHGGRHQLCYRWQARVIDPLLKRCARWASRPTPAPSYPSNCFVFSFFFHQNENYQSKKCRRHVGFHPAQGFTTSCVRVFRYGAKKKRNEECKLNNGVRKSRLLYHRWSSSPRPRLNRITTTELLVLWQQTVKFLFLSPSL